MFLERLNRWLCGWRNHIPTTVAWGIAWGQPSYFIDCMRCDLTTYGPWNERPVIKGVPEIYGTREQRRRLRYQKHNWKRELGDAN